jgi:glucokinase
VAGAGEFLRSRVEKVWTKFAFPAVRQSTKIELTQLGSDAGVVGAASLAREFA